MMHHVVAPGTHFAPTVENGNFLDAVGCYTADVVVKRPEFIADVFDIVNKIGELKRQLKIAAVADTGNRASENGSSCRYPVDLGFGDRVAAFVENIGEEVGQKASLGIFYALDVAEKAEGCSVAYTSDNCIKTDGFKFLHERLHADPVVAHEHHRFLAVFMNDVNHFLGKLCDLPSLESLKVLELFRGNAVGVVHIALIDDEFRAERIADLFFELL